MSCIPGTAPKPWGLRRTELHLYWIAPELGYSADHPPAYDEFSGPPVHDNGTE